MKLPLFLLCFFFSFSFASENLKTFTVLHTNDLHGMLLPFDHDVGKDRGGLARRAGCVKKIRNTTNHPVILVDAGDIFTRGPWHMQFFGLPEVDAMNQMDYDLATVGNNEFKAYDFDDYDTANRSQEKLIQLMARSHFPWIAANVWKTYNWMPLAGSSPYVIKTFDGIRIGFLGLTAPRSQQYPQVQGLTIADPIVVAKEIIPEMKKHCDIIIAVTHLGCDDDTDPETGLFSPSLDRRLAQEVSGIDFIVGGDSHTFLWEPLVFKNPDGQLVPIVQAGELGVELGKIEVTFEYSDHWRLKAFSSRLIPIDASCGEDYKVKNIINLYIDSQNHSNATEKQYSEIGLESTWQFFMSLIST